MVAFVRLKRNEKLSDDRSSITYITFKPNIRLNLIAICIEIDSQSCLKPHRFVPTMIHINYFHTEINLSTVLCFLQVTQAGEMLILTFGIQLAFASRNAITQFRVSVQCQYFLLNINLLFVEHLFQERQFLVASIVLEFLVSFSYYIIRDWYLSELNPTTLFLALFIRSQLTSTISMVLIFMPKIYYQHKQVRYSMVEIRYSLFPFRDSLPCLPPALQLLLLLPEEMNLHYNISWQFFMLLFPASLLHPLPSYPPQNASLSYLIINNSFESSSIFMVV